MNYSKIAGWILLAAGIGLIVWTLFSSYNIFTAKADLPGFFKAPEEQIAAEKGKTQDIQVQMEKMISEQLKEILPSGAATKILNLSVWSMLAFILIFGGSQVSILGIKLIKK